jgi:hypothetical protein
MSRARRLPDWLIIPLILPVVASLQGPGNRLSGVLFAGIGLTIVIIGVRLILRRQTDAAFGATQGPLGAALWGAVFAAVGLFLVVLGAAMMMHGPAWQEWFGRSTSAGSGLGWLAAILGCIVLLYVLTRLAAPAGPDAGWLSMARRTIETAFYALLGLGLLGWAIALLLPASGIGTTSEPVRAWLRALIPW